MPSYNVDSLEMLDQIAKLIADELKITDIRIVLFYGEMGAGKTSLIAKICKHMGIVDNVTSPTFAIVNEYKGQKFNINHFDFYRIENVKEIFDIGFEEYLNSEDYNFIEWPEKVEGMIINEKFLKISIFIEKNHSRSIIW